MRKKRKRISGSMTIESAVLLPFFLIIFMNLYSAIEQYRIHSSIMCSLWECGRERMKQGYINYALEDLDENQIIEAVLGGNKIVSWFAMRKRVVENLDIYPLWRNLVIFQENGLIVELRENGDIVDISCGYATRPLFSMGLFGNGVRAAHFYGHAFTGYDKELYCSKDEEEEYVYITKTGTVYHKNRGCSYLCPSIRMVPSERIGMERNESGGRYIPCSVCDRDSEGMYYVTNYGDVFHTTTECSTLSRTVFKITLSEAGGRNACSKCSGG